MKVMIVDTETGGIDRDKHSVLSVGVCVGNLDTGEIINTLEALHKKPSLEDYVFTKTALELNELKIEDCFTNGQTSEELRDKIIDLYVGNNCSHLGGHNVHFDVGMLTRDVFQVPLKEFEANFGYRYLDSSPVIRLISGDTEVKSGNTLKQLSKTMKIDMSDFSGSKFHTALFDAVCTFRILHKFRKVFTMLDVVERLQA